MSALAVVEAVLAHLERREGAEVIELLHPDISWTVPEVLPFGGTVTGPGAVARGLASIWEHVFDWGTQADEVHAFGERVVAMGRHPVATSEGVVVDVPFLSVWQVADGKVVCFEEHLDTLQFLRAVGRSATG